VRSERTRINKLEGGRGKTVTPGQIMGLEIYKVAKKHEIAK
jgi:hypothetical protein